ncbi:hypothetical protein KFE25_004315 [Diacronema lutheri]|uniref:Sulfotransferase n=1 Tax=Diacronema lutheri TaxID=2081491 RepID=A0A8J6C132_DIALT|nr:hypothetical protein KFE25_004315 [Diacronema lutheri]
MPRACTRACSLLALGIAASPALLSAARPAAGGVHGCDVERRLPPTAKHLCALDRKARLMLCSAPKAAATTVSAVMVRVANESAHFASWMRAEYNVTDVADEHMSPRVNYFRMTVFSRDDAHAVPDNIVEQCAQADWLCVAIVRSPLDRVISSFLHVALTKLGPMWPELLEAVGDASRIRAANFSLRQFVHALELTRRSFVEVGSTRRPGAEHYLPQTSAWLDDLLHPAARGKPVARLAPHYPASLVKFVAVDSLAAGMGAVDDEFRGGALGLRAIVEGLHSSHWRSAQPSHDHPHGGPRRSLLRAGSPRDDAPRPWSRPTGKAALRAARRARDERAGPAGETYDAAPLVDADTPAAVLCGSFDVPPPATVTSMGRVASSAPRRKKPGSRCALVPGAYERLQRGNAPLWRRIRCLYHYDFELYERRVCSQAWLRAACPACVARACGRAAL